MSSIACRMNLIGVVLCAGMTFACGASSANAPEPVAASATSTSAVVDDVSAGLRDHHRFHHHGGVTLFIAMSLDTLGVSPEQKATVEKIRTDLHARMEPARSAEQSLVATLADGLASGSIDAARVDAALAAVNAAAAAVHGASADALNELHRALTPVQRGALVDKVDAHWSVWQEANAEEAGAASATDGHLAILQADLSLTPDQVTRIRASLAEKEKRLTRPDSQEMATRLRTFGDAFRSDAFDARTLAAASAADAHMVGRGAAHMASFIEAVSPILTVDQRTQLAERLREHAAHNPSAQGTP